MSDSRKYWKESIGVTPASRRRREGGHTGPTGAAASTGVVEKKSEKSTSAPLAEEGDTGPITGPAGATVQRGPSRTTERIGKSPSRPEASAAPSVATGSEAEINELLGSLPVGSYAFAEEVARKLWVRPSPADLRALSLVAGERHRVAELSLRSLAVSAVGLRLRAERLGAALSRPVLDASVLQARAVEWGRLSRRCEELAGKLAEAGEEVPGADVLIAARRLLPDALDLLAESTLTSEIADVVHSLGEGMPREAVAAASRVPDIEPLVVAVQDHKLRPSDGLFIEIFSAGSLVARALRTPRQDALRLARRVVHRLGERFERAVERMQQAHARDPEGQARLGAWGRYLRELRLRIDEALTHPVPHHVPDEPGEAGATGPIEAPAGTKRGREERLVESLRSVRAAHPAKTEPPKSAGPAGPESESSSPGGAEGAVAKLKSKLRWIPFVSSIGLGFALLGLFAHALFTDPIPMPPSATPSDFESAAPLVRTESAGALLVATAPPGFEELDVDEKHLRAGRLRARAEELGFAAGLLVAPDGRPLVSWEPGRTPRLRRPPGMVSAFAELEPSVPSPAR